MIESNIACPALPTCPPCLAEAFNSTDKIDAHPKKGL